MGSREMRTGYCKSRWLCMKSEWSGARHPEPIVRRVLVLVEAERLPRHMLASECAVMVSHLTHHPHKLKTRRSLQKLLPVLKQGQSGSVPQMVATRHGTAGSAQRTLGINISICMAGEAHYVYGRLSADDVRDYAKAQLVLLPTTLLLRLSINVQHGKANRRRECKRFAALSRVASIHGLRCFVCLRRRNV